jgi:hypothetical protein
VDECKPLANGTASIYLNVIAAEGTYTISYTAFGTTDTTSIPAATISVTIGKCKRGRGLHPFTFQLNVSAYYGIGGPLRGYSGEVYVV